MIIGTGIDLCDIRRIEKALDRHGERFLARVFSDDEQALIASRALPARAATCAKRFAAKEACAKALGTGFNHGVYYRDIGVVSLEHGKPGLVLTGQALARLQALTPEGKQARIDLSLTDEYPLAMAQVILQAV